MSFNNAFSQLRYFRDKSGNISSIYTTNPKNINKREREKKEYQYLRSQERDSKILDGLNEAGKHFIGGHNV